MTIPWWHPVLGDEEALAAAQAVASGFPNDGAVTEEFASRIAELVGVSHGIGVSSGSAALYCALVACGVRPGDEVIVPDLTFVATANAVVLAGAKPVLVDVRRDDLGLDPDGVERAVTPRTRAVVPVHVNGRAGAIEAVVEVARDRGLAVVEDAAEALGSRRGARALGSYGDAACFSFAPSKIVTAGQGGVVVTADAALSRRVRQVKDHGRAERGTGGADDHPVFGFNFKLSNVHAAIALAQLARLRDRMAQLRRLRTWYEQELGGLEPAIALPHVDAAGGEALEWIDAFADERDAVVAGLAERGIETRAFWRPLHAHPPYAAPAERFPNATWAAARGVWLPSALTLTRADVARVGEAVRELVAARRPAAVAR